MKVSLTEAEIEALYAAAGNIDPCMFEEMGNVGDRLFDAWNTGREKLGNALGTINARKIVDGKSPKVSLQLRNSSTARAALAPEQDK